MACRFRRDLAPEPAIDSIDSIHPPGSALRNIQPPPGPSGAWGESLLRKEVCCLLDPRTYGQTRETAPSRSRLGRIRRKLVLGQKTLSSRRHQKRQRIRHNLDVPRQPPRIFAVDLDINPLIRRRAQAGFPRPNYRYATHSVQKIRRHASQVLQILARLTAGEKHNLELVVENANAPRNLQVASVIPHLRDQRKGAPMDAVIDLDVELLEVPCQLPEPAGPVGQLAPAPLHIWSQTVDN